MQKSMFIWKGDNFGCDSEEVLVDVQTDEGSVSMNLEKVLHRIDDFSCDSQKRILAGLSHHFDI